MLLALALACHPADTDGTDLHETDSTTDTDVHDTDGPGAFDVPGASGRCTAPIDAADVTHPDHVVGDGTAGSCTPEALAAAVAAGGTITFDCGGAVTIATTATLAITSDTVIDGGGLVTLDGGGDHRILELDTGNFEAVTPTLTVQDLAFTRGHASGTPTALGTDIDGGGGAIWHLGGGVRVIGCAFDANEGADWGPDVGGGAIYGVGRGETTIVRSRFTGNSAANGGAIGVLGGPLVVIDSVIEGNEATGRGANSVDNDGNQVGHGGNGGGIVMDGEGQRLHICGTQVTGNAGGAFGGGLFRTGYASEPSDVEASAFLDNTLAEDEENTGGGGLYVQGTIVTMSATTVARNRAKGNAGLWVLGHGAAHAQADLTNVTLADNAVYPAGDPELSGLGGGLTIGDNTSGTLLNCTITGNTAGFAAGIVDVSPLTVRNTVLSNTALNVYNPLNCLGSAFSSPPGSGSPNLQWPHGNTDMDCTAGIDFADPLVGSLSDDPVPTAALDPSSPGIGAGTDCPATDALGSPRAADGCDLGAVESP
jgi:hypothetical protein